MKIDNFNKHLYLLLSSVQNQVQSPMPLVVTSMLSTLSASMQDFVRVTQPIGVETPTSLFCMSIAESGERKTTVDKLLSKPIYDFEQTKLAHDQILLETYKKEHELWKIQYKEAKRLLTNAIRRQHNNQAQLEKSYLEITDREPQLPSTNRRIFSDVTIESLLSELNKSTLGGLFISTEAGNILSRMNTNFTSSLNGLWDGDAISIDRKTSPSFTLKNKPLVCSFMLQPSIFDQIMKTKENTSRGSGFLARFLICKPESTQGTRFIKPASSDSHLNDFYRRITEILEQSSHYKSNDKVVVLSFDSQATQRWVNCANRIESLIDNNAYLSEIKDHASKIMNNISRVAALLHYYEYGNEDTQGYDNTFINLKTLENAIDLLQYYTDQFKSIFGEKTFKEEAWNLGKKLHDYLVRNYNINNRFITKDSLYRNGPKQIRKQDKLNIAIDELLMQNYLTYVQDSKPIKFYLSDRFIYENNLPY